MKLSITYLELKGPFYFFSLSKKALKIIRQLKTTSCKGYKSIGFWKKHYTMTLWENEEQMKNFVKSGAHLDAMKTSASIAKEIKVITIDGEELISWKKAKKHLENATNILRF